MLQPSCFMEIWLGPALGWDLSAGTARVFGTGEAPISYISLSDVAEFVAMVVDQPQAECQTIPLGGPEPVSQVTAVQLFEEVTGRAFTVRRIHEWMLRAMSLLWRPVSPLHSSLQALGAVVARGDAIDMTITLQRYPIVLTAVRDNVRTWV